MVRLERRRVRPECTRLRLHGGSKPFSRLASPQNQKRRQSSPSQVTKLMGLHRVVQPSASPGPSYPTCGCPAGGFCRNHWHALGVSYPLVACHLELWIHDGLGRGGGAAAPAPSAHPAPAPAAAFPAACTSTLVGCKEQGPLVLLWVGGPAGRVRFKVISVIVFF